MAETFTTTILQAEGLNATGISVPPEVISALGTQKRPKVVVTLNGYTYRTTVAPFGDVFMIPLSQEHREASGLKAGDEVEVTIALDVEPRTVEVPEDLAAALSARPGATEAFERLAYSRRKEFVRQVNEAKA
ncbi:MAG TPA: YdeI/OmpD-associated family protein, partial [Chloroflexia bacterium]|nr:YdeI/OmpD-associated family protein [Chloroflexia bacterium]